MSQLTARQQRFVDELTVCGNAAEAARRAGYSARSAKQLGSRLTKVDHIQRLVAEKRQQQAVELELRKEDVLSGLLSSVQMGRTKGEAATMIRGLVELGKLCGYYDSSTAAAPHAEVSPWPRQKYEAMTDMELLEVINGRAP